MVTVIAEPGCTAEGHLDRMTATIAAIAASGADVYKATWIEDVSAVLRQRHMDDASPYRQVYEWHAWPESWHAVLRDQCAERGIRYACTVHTPAAAAAVAPYVSAIKIASFEARHTELIDAAIETGREVWVSTGMMTAAEVHAIWQPCRLFHCVSAYPTPLSDLHLSLLHTGIYDGFSDHTDPRATWTGAIAAAAGAQFIEAHVAHTSHPDNPDAAIAMDMAQWASYVRHTRWAERALGDGRKGIQASEEPLLALRASM